MGLERSGAVKEPTSHPCLAAGFEAPTASSGTGPQDHRPGSLLRVCRGAEARLPTRAGEFRMLVYTGEHDASEQVALVAGSLEGPAAVLVRMHSECLTGDVFGSQRCDCGRQLELALQRVQASGRGVLLYLRQEGRGIGLLNKTRAYRLQELGRDTVEANLELGLDVDPRDYCLAAAILRDLGVLRVRLLTNNPAKVRALESCGLQVERASLEVPATPGNAAYLRTKRDRMGHLLDLV